MRSTSCWTTLTLAGVLASSVLGCATDADLAHEDETSANAAPSEPTMQQVAEPAAAPTATTAPDAAAAPTTRVAANSRALKTVKESPSVAPWFNVYRPADLKATGEPLPVVVWANGGCFRSDFTWAPLYEKWASGGFVVLALTESTQTPALSQSTVKDQIGLIDWAVKQNQTEGSPYFGALDLKRIVAAGNSCGGITALGTAAQDPRVTSVFVLSGSSAMPFSGPDAAKAVMSKVKVPLGFVVGGPQDIAGANATKDYDLLAAGIPAMIVSRNQGDHVKVSTDTTVLPEVAKIALDWMDLTLYGTPAAKETLSSPTVCTGCQSGTWKLKSKNFDKL